MEHKVNLDGITDRGDGVIRTMIHAAKLHRNLLYSGGSIGLTFWGLSALPLCNDALALIGLREFSKTYFEHGMRPPIELTTPALLLTGLAVLLSAGLRGWLQTVVLRGLWSFLGHTFGISAGISLVLFLRDALRADGPDWKMLVGQLFFVQFILVLFGLLAWWFVMFLDGELTRLYERRVTETPWEARLWSTLYSAIPLIGIGLVVLAYKDTVHYGEALQSIHATSTESGPDSALTQQQDAVHK